MLHLFYPKIPAAARASCAAPGGEWIATEKLHGAQLVVGFDGKQVRFGKRKAWLAATDPFFGWQLLRDPLERAARIAFAMATERTDTSSVRLYGEIYGGSYPHPAVCSVPGVRPVQTGIWYSPDIRFALFDILDRKDQQDPGTFRPYRQLGDIAGAAGLDLVPELASGHRTALAELPHRFPTQVPIRLGLPQLAGNLAEGIVLRPAVSRSASHQTLVKWKIREFDEARFDGSEAWDPQQSLTTDQLANLAGRLVNLPRITSAASKVGWEPREALLGEVLLDVIIDLTDAYPTAMASLAPVQEARLAQQIHELAAAMLNP